MVVAVVMERRWGKSERTWPRFSPRTSPDRCFFSSAMMLENWLMIKLILAHRSLANVEVPAARTTYGRRSSGRKRSR